MEEESEYGCWMWRKRKQYCLSSINFNVASPPTTRPTPIFNSFYDHPHHHHHQDHVASSSSSWEEQAFAADHQQGHVNNGVGCIWPPPSYSCNFCNREFKSAQALGGHMNVHRRDRARLKQPPNPIIHNHNNIIIHQRVLEEESESKGKGTTFFDAANSPNSSLHDLVASPASASTKDNDEYFGEDLILDLHLRVGHHKRRRLMMSTTTDHQASSTPIFFTKSTISVDNMIKQPQMFEFVNPNSIIEELDLELRLGHSTPKSQ